MQIVNIYEHLVQMCVINSVTRNKCNMQSYRVKPVYNYTNVKCSFLLVFSEYINVKFP